MWILRSVIEKGIIIYLDNILLAYKTEEEYRKMIKKILQLLAEAELKIKKKKCSYFQNQIKFLEFILSEEKIRKNLRKLKYI